MEGTEIFFQQFSEQMAKTTLEFSDQVNYPEIYSLYLKNFDIFERNIPLPEPLKPENMVTLKGKFFRDFL